MTTKPADYDELERILRARAEYAVITLDEFSPGNKAENQIEWRAADTIERLERELAEALEQLSRKEAVCDELYIRNSATERELAAMLAERDALLEYARHKSDCHLVFNLRNRETGELIPIRYRKCTCGLDAAIDALKEQP